jgi:hypothetical protein
MFSDWSGEYGADDDLRMRSHANRPGPHDVDELIDNRIHFVA